jgi:hypothetical protein
MVRAPNLSAAHYKSAVLRVLAVHPFGMARCVVGLPTRGVGLGLRLALAPDVWANAAHVDFLEVVAEQCFADRAMLRQAQAFAELWPVVPHGVKLSLGSAEGIDVQRAQRLGSLARELRSPVISEHVAFTRAGGREIGHLTQLPLTREVVAVVARNVARARRYLPDVPLLLENPAWTFRWPQDEMDEPTFFHEIAEATGCDLLLDLANLYANALNAGLDPQATLERFPLDRVRMVHIAGGAREHGFYFDTHAHPTPAPVFDLLERLVERMGPVPVLLERDDQFPAFDAIKDELALTKATLDASRRARVETSSAARRTAEMTVAVTTALVALQSEMAHSLTRVEPDPEAGRGVVQIDLARARDVLRRKRVEEALSVLVHLAPLRERVRPFALQAVSARERAPQLAAVEDAVATARLVAQEDENCRHAATLDLLRLRASFKSLNKGGFEARVGPFVGRERLRDGSTVWIAKGFGGFAKLHVFKRGNASNGG